MNRIKITKSELNYDDEGTTLTLVGWFDSDSAVEYREAREWNGQNLVGVNNLGDYGHQILYRTAMGRWVLNTWSQWVGVPQTYEYVDDQRARDWLLINDHDDAVTKWFGFPEPERGPGRPEKGPAVSVRLDDQLAPVDTYAAAEGISRAEAVRQLVALGLNQTTQSS